jgi:diaminopimelate epimerase
VAYVKDNLNELLLDAAALPIRHDEVYAPGGTNVNFIESLGADAISMRTFERGVEGETLSCGTGVTAAALVHGSLNEKQQIEIKTKGGILHVRFEKSGPSAFQNIFLIGPAQAVYSGQIHL